MAVRKWFLVIGLGVTLALSQEGSVASPDGKEIESITGGSDGQRVDTAANSSGHLIFVKRLSDGTYVPTSISMLLIVLAVVFFFRRKRK